MDDKNTQPSAGNVSQPANPISTTSQYIDSHQPENKSQAAEADHILGIRDLRKAGKEHLTFAHHQSPHGHSPHYHYSTTAAGDNTTTSKISFQQTASDKLSRQMELERKKTNEFAEEMGGFWQCCGKR